MRSLTCAMNSWLAVHILAHCSSICQEVHYHFSGRLVQFLSRSSCVNSRIRSSFHFRHIQQTEVRLVNSWGGGWVNLPSRMQVDTCLAETASTQFHLRCRVSSMCAVCIHSHFVMEHNQCKFMGQNSGQPRNCNKSQFILWPIRLRQSAMSSQRCKFSFHCRAAYLDAGWQFQWWLTMICSWKHGWGSEMTLPCFKADPTYNC